MRSRDAKRYSDWAYRVGRLPIDIVAFVLLRVSIFYDNKRRVYRTRLARTRLHLSHPCFFKLAVCVYREYVSETSVLQGQVVGMEGVRDTKGLLSSILQEIPSPFVIRGERNYGGLSKLRPVPRSKVVTKILDDVFAEELSPPEIDKIKSGYINSSRINDESLMTQVCTKLALKPPKPLNRNVMKVMLLQKIAREKLSGNYKTRDMSFEAPDLAQMDSNLGSAAGIVPVRPVQGVATQVAGNKGSMIGASVCINVRDFLGSAKPPYQPVKPFPKEEVIKMGKSVRGIQNESHANYLILKKFLDDTTKFEIGDAIGMGSMINGYQIIFFLWYLEFAESGGGSWDDFIQYLKIMGAHESDKTGWEASTNITDGLPEVIYKFGTIKLKGENEVLAGNKRLLIRAFADAYCPIVYLDRKSYQAPWRVPSGTAFTASGNTDRHRGMNQFMCHFIATHGNKLGSPTCGCCICSAYAGELGLEVTKMSLALRKKAFILGDDYISVSMGPRQDAAFDGIMDLVFGTETKTEHKNMFDEAEFLRRSYKLLDGNRIAVYRSSERVLAKLYHGSFVRNASATAAALVSLKMEAGYNEKLHRVIEKVMLKLKPLVIKADYDKTLKEYFRRNPAIGDVECFMSFDMYDTVNLQLQCLKPILNIALAKWVKPLGGTYVRP